MNILGVAPVSSANARRLALQLARTDVHMISSWDNLPVWVHSHIWRPLDKLLWDICSHTYLVFSFLTSLFLIFHLKRSVFRLARPIYPNNDRRDHFQRLPESRVVR
jgi:hypothetical protein